MKLISLNASLPRGVSWRGERILTGIFKSAVSGPRRLSQFNLDGDAQADLTLHGGRHKAIYGYPLEHYDYWRTKLPEKSLTWGMFGENFTTEGLLEDQVCIGERFQLGSAEVQVTEPRLPCYKLGIRHGRTDMVKRFLASRRTGFYFAVVKPGVVEAGQVFEQIHRPAHGITIADVVRVLAFDPDDLFTMQKITQIEDLSDAWRNHFRQKLYRYGHRSSEIKGAL